MAKISYRVRNWNTYNQALVQRGDLTLWLDKEMVDCWLCPRPVSRRGRPASYHSDAILTCLVIRYAVGLPYRQTEGFIDSIFKLMGVDLCAPNYSYLCKQAATMALNDNNIAEAASIAIDSSGFKVAGEGEWLVRTHGKKRQRKWIKLHIAVNLETREISANLVTTSNTHDSKVFEQLLPAKVGTILADGAYDSQNVHDVASKKNARALVPPRANAVLGPEPLPGQRESPRDQLILLQELLGDEWRKILGYTMRVHVEGAFSRIKRIFGDKVRSKTMLRQTCEMLTKITVLNRFTSIGMPVAVAIR